MTLGEREAQDLQRGRQYIAAARCHCNGSGERSDIEGRYIGECVCGINQQPENIGDGLFGPYACTICPSYGHPTSMHRQQAQPLADRPEA